MIRVVKQTLMTAVLIMLAVPAMAEAPTKGTKSYQAARDEAPAANTQAAPAATTAEDAAQVAPAAGDTSNQDKADQGKTMREEMKLPRKN